MRIKNWRHAILSFDHRPAEHIMAEDATASGHIAPAALDPEHVVRQFLSTR